MDVLSPSGAPQDTGPGVLGAPPPQQGHPRARETGWPLILVFAGIPLWWVLGLFQIVFVAACVPMVRHLHRQRVAAPRGFGTWLLYLLWLIGGLFLLQIDAPGTIPGDDPGRYVVFAYRLGWYAAATIFLLYVINSRHLLTTRRVCLAIGWMFVFLTFGGLLGLFAPDLEFPSLLELLLPGSLTSNGFVQSLIHPQVAQVQSFLGYEQPRPSAPFPVANQWGAAMALTAPFFVVSWWQRGGWHRRITPLVSVLSLVPIVGSLNRGLWVALIAMSLFALVQLARAGRPRALVAATVLLTLLLVGVVLSPWGDLVQQRLDTPHSNEGRTNLAGLTLSSTWNGSPILGFGTTRDVQGNFTSIAGGSTFFCPNCAPPPLGTQGQLWQVVFASGFVGALIYLTFLLGQLLRRNRPRSGLAIAAQCSLVAALVTMPVYNAVHPGIVVIFVAMGILVREVDAGALIDVRTLTRSAFRSKRTVLALTLLGLGAGVGLHQLAPAPYSATQRVLLTGSATETSGPADPDLEAVLARSTGVLRVIARATDAASPLPAGQHYRVTATPTSSILQIEVTDPDRSTAAAAAESAATTYLAERHQRRKTTLMREQESQRRHLGVILEAERTVGELPGGGNRVSSTAPDPLASQKNVALDALARVDAADATTGELVGPPEVSRSPDRLLVLLVSGAWLGLVGGLILNHLRTPARRS